MFDIVLSGNLIQESEKNYLELEISQGIYK